MRWAFLVFLTLHALIHSMGVAKAFGWAELDQLSQPISRIGGAVWLAACLALLAAAGMFVAAPRWWWVPGLIGVALSQGLVVAAWGDAKFGTVANVVTLVALAYGFASQGPMSLRATYEREVQQRLESAGEAPTVTDDDLADLPEPVACYLRRAGVVGQPRARNFKATWKGWIRSTAADDWMEFTAEQHNFLTDPARFFMMDAKRGGLPVDVLHRFVGGQASMKVKLASIVTMVDTGGPELSRAETVTLLNDMAILAPSGLLGSGVSWQPLDQRSARVGFTLGSNTVLATLMFNEHCDLVDFVSDDRAVLAEDGKTFTPQRWSTPLRDHRTFGPYRVAGHGEGWWHPPSGEFAYLEMDLIDLRINEVAD